MHYTEAKSLERSYLASCKVFVLAKPEHRTSPIVYKGALFILIQSIDVACVGGVDLIPNILYKYIFVISGC